MRSAAFSTAIVLIVGLAAVPACKVKPGDRCTKGLAGCQDSATQLICQNETFIASPCRGPRGCRREGDTVQCDVSMNKEGDPCSTDKEGSGQCGADAKSFVGCIKGGYRVSSCRGASGCKQEGEDARCDQSVASEGERCTGKGSACSVDGKTLLECEKEKFVTTLRCRGPAACKVKERNTPWCDQSNAEVGDTCSPGFACSTDGRQFLKCTAGKMAVARTCRGQAGCIHEGNNVKCAEGTLAEPGDVCFDDGFACSVDRMAVLRCKGGQFAEATKCKCGLKGNIVGCN